ncbi:unnamed protein product [Amoebophrya sp. A25]|nr:unnamed protein product [Amoebophrya sp. A25]|eukprot:GSA25T00003730001.1
MQQTYERVVYGTAHMMAPVFGKLSDETKHPWGKRRPMMAFALILVVGSHAVLYVASERLWMSLYLVGLFFAMIAKNMVIAVNAAFLTDVVPKELSSSAASITAAQAACGCIIGFLIQYWFADAHVKYTYLIVTFFFLLTQAIFFAAAREPPTSNIGEEGNDVDSTTIADEMMLNAGENLHEDEHEDGTFISARIRSGKPHEQEESQSSAEPEAEAEIQDLEEQAAKKGQQDKKKKKRKAVDLEDQGDNHNHGQRGRGQRGTSTTRGAAATATTTSTAARRSIIELLKESWRESYNALTLSQDYGLLAGVRVVFYSACSCMSMFLFYLRDALHVPTRAEGIRQLSVVAILSQCTVLLFAIPASLLLSEQQSYHDETGLQRVQTPRTQLAEGTRSVALQKTLSFLGILAQIFLFLALVIVPGFALSHGPDFLSGCVYVGGILYGLSTCLMAIGDMGLALRLVPAGVGHGAAMALFGPSTTYGYVLGSVVIGFGLSFFKVAPDAADLTSQHPLLSGMQKENNDAGKQVPGMGAAGGIDGDWVPAYKTEGYQMISLCCIMLCILSAVLLYLVDTPRALRASLSVVQNYKQDSERVVDEESPATSNDDHEQPGTSETEFAADDHVGEFHSRVGRAGNGR